MVRRTSQSTVVQSSALHATTLRILSVSWLCPERTVTGRRRREGLRGTAFVQRAQVKLPAHSKGAMTDLIANVHNRLDILTYPSPTYRAAPTAPQSPHPSSSRQGSLSSSTDSPAILKAPPLVPSAIVAREPPAGVRCEASHSCASLVVQRQFADVS